MNNIKADNKFLKVNNNNEGFFNGEVEYKGIYFNDDKKKTYYEWGAHFSYKDLCKRLEKLVIKKSIKSISIESKFGIFIVIIVDHDSKQSLFAKNTIKLDQIENILQKYDSNKKDPVLKTNTNIKGSDKPKYKTRNINELYQNNTTLKSEIEQSAFPSRINYYNHKIYTSFNKAEIETYRFNDSRSKSKENNKYIYLKPKEEVNTNKKM